MDGRVCDWSCGDASEHTNELVTGSWMWLRDVICYRKIAVTCSALFEREAGCSALREREAGRSVVGVEL